MKVILLNGSPHEKGCTYTALTEVAKTLHEAGIETEVIQAGDPSMEKVREAAEKLKTADGLVVGSPVYWAAPTGQILLFLDRLVSIAGNDLKLKPAAAIASARRAGTTATLEVLDKFLAFHQMPRVSSFYWPMVHGNTPEEVKQDKEGLQIMRALGCQTADCCRLERRFEIGGFEACAAQSGR